MKTNTQFSEGHPYFKRFIAFIIDWYVSSFAAMIPVIAAQSILAKDLVLENRIDLLPTVPAAVSAAVATVIYIVYFCALPLKNEHTQTLGRKLLDLRLEEVNGNHPGFKNLFLREVVGVLILQGNTTSVNTYITSVISDLVNTGAFVPYIQAIFIVILTLSSVLVLVKDHRNLQDRLSGTRMVGLNKLK